MSGPVAGLTLAGEPRVQLLPPSVKEREKVKSARRLMGLLVVLAVVVAGAATGYAILLATQAEVRLAAAQDRTLDILAQQAEFSEATAVATQVGATERALREVTANEIDWVDLSSDVLAYLSCACTATISFTGPAPWEAELIPEGPLRPSRVATMTLEIASGSYADAADFVNRVRDMEGVADAVITASTLDGTQYSTTVVLTFDSTVLALRFAPEGEQPESTDEESTEAAGTAAPESTPAPTMTEGAVP